MGQSGGVGQMVVSVPAGTRIGDFQVVSELGRGGMGAVFRVRHLATGGTYALKLLLPGLVESESGTQGLARFSREIDALAKLDGHPNIVRLFVAGRHGGSPFYVMEHVEGRTLKDVCDDRPMDPEQAARFTSKIARAVEHAHARGVLHRDLKPGNIIIDPTGEPHILDFGLARSNDSSSLTKSGELLGTPGYMAPEQVETGGGVAMGPATDVYGLGSVLYHLLTGDRPFKGTSRLNTIAAVLTKHPTPPRSIVADLSPELEAICLRAMEKAADARYSSAGSFADDLDRWLAGEPVGARPLGRMARLGRRFIPARGPRRAAAIATIVAAAVVVVAAMAVGVAAFVLNLGAEATRKDQAALEKRLAEWDALYKLAAKGGDPEKIEPALAMLRDDATVRARADADAKKVLDGLAKLAKGDEVLVRTLSFDGPPWANHAGAVVAVLARCGHARALFTLLERQPTLIAKVAHVDVPILEKAVGAAIDSDKLELSARVTDGLASNIEHARNNAAATGPSADDATMAARDAARASLDRLLVKVLARRIRSIVPAIASDAKALAAKDVDAVIAASDELRARVDTLLGAVPRADALAAVGETTADALASFARLVKFESGDAVKLWGVAKAMVDLLGLDDRRIDDLALLLQGFGFYAQQADARRDVREAGFEAGLILYRRGASWPFPYELGEIGRDIDLEARAKTALDAGDVDTLVALFTLLRNATERAGTPAAAGGFAERHWAIVEAVVARAFDAKGDARPRDADPPPPSAWAVGMLADELYLFDLWWPSGRTIAHVERRDPVAAKAIRDTLARFGLAPTREGVQRFVDRLFRAAMQSWEAIEAPWWRHRVLLAHLRWIKSTATADDASSGLDLATLRRATKDVHDIAELRDFEGKLDRGWALRREAIVDDVRRIVEDVFHGVYTRAASRAGASDDLAAWGAALEEHAKACEAVVPRSWVPDGVRALDLIRLRQPAKALAALRRGIENDLPEAADPGETEPAAPLPVDTAWILVATIHADHGRADEARAALANVRDGELGPLSLEQRAAVWRTLGERARAAADAAAAKAYQGWRGF